MRAGVALGGLLLHAAWWGAVRAQQEWDDDISYTRSYEAPAPFWASCDWAWVDDGVCDFLCNTAERQFDGKDCFHGASECYNSSTGVDYRGTVNQTASGRPCQYWSSQFPNMHKYNIFAYPHSGLGGHNFCRNPAPDEEKTGPWCYVDSLTAPAWEYCDVAPPTAVECDDSYLPKKQPMTTLKMGECHVATKAQRALKYGSGRAVPTRSDQGSVVRLDKVQACGAPRQGRGRTSPCVIAALADEWSDEFFVYEASYHFYQVPIPPSVESVEVVLLPEDGDPDMYLSFDIE
eukprot:scaffold238579_cov33-Tisochrysis_lutea.AAC.5